MSPEDIKICKRRIDVMSLEEAKKVIIRTSRRDPLFTDPEIHAYFLNHFKNIGGDLKMLKSAIVF